MSINWAPMPPKVRLDNLHEKNQELQQIRAASSSAQPASPTSSEMPRFTSRSSSSERGQEPWSP
eukprot:304870-Lingulodinium_polyedra.AAC.1